MPRGDGTGPAGMGPMTGRAMGLCAGYETPGFANYGRGRRMNPGWGRGPGAFGPGRGQGRRFYEEEIPRTDPESEKQALKMQADSLRTQLDDLLKRLEEIS